MTPTNTIIESFPHDRRFGIELEFFNLSRSEVKEKLTEAGVACYLSNDDYEVDGGWKITYDSSIHSDDEDEYGVELVSPILSGPDGLREVEKVAKVLTTAGAKVNKTCGFHVHVDATDLSAITLRNTFKRYALHEVQIDTFQVKSRRESVNEFCRSNVPLLTRFETMNPLASTMNPRQMVQVVSREEYDRNHGTYTGGRYYKLNLCAFLRHGTIEFRHHSGTVNAEKVVNWVVFCVNFVVTSIASESANIFTDLHPEVVDFFNERARVLNTEPEPRTRR